MRPTFGHVAALALSIAAASCSESSAKEPPRGPGQGLAADNTGHNVRDRDGELPTPFDQGESETDRRITQAIRKVLSADSTLSLNAKNVKIVTVNGAVTLRGTAKTAREKSTVESAAKAQAGVTQVKNLIDVEQP